MIYGAQFRQNSINLQSDKTVRINNKKDKRNSCHLLSTLVNVQEQVVISFIIIIMPEILSMIFGVLQHNYIILKELENLCLNVASLEEGDWDWKIYNGILNVCLDRTKVKLCRQDLEKDLTKFFKDLQENDKKILKVFESDISWENLNIKNSCNLVVLKYSILISKLLILIDIDNSINTEKYYSNNEIYKICARLQTLFLESKTILIYSILKIKSEKGSQTSGVDGLCFKNVEVEKQNVMKKRLKNTKYDKSKKSLKIKKDLPNKAQLTEDEILDLRKKVETFNKELVIKLYNLCNIKTFRKNFKGQTVRRVWIPKLGTNEMSPLGIPTLRDRVLQFCIYIVTLPFIELFSDTYSFGGRPERSALDCVALVCKKLTHIGRGTSNSGIQIKRVNKEIFEKYKGRKQIVRGRRFHSFKAKKTRRHYENLYYIAVGSDRIASKKMLQHEFYKYINVDIKSCFDEISHEYILKVYPIVDKYKYLLKAWLEAPIYGTEDSRKNIYISLYPKKGVPQGSILGPVICNCVLNGLEYNLTKKYNIKEIGKTRWILRSIKCIRFIDDILIIGKSDEGTFELLFDKLKFFLKERGLFIKDENLTSFKKFEEFKPGNSFEYLGFKFIYPDINLRKFKNGKFTKYNICDFYSRLKGLNSVKSKQRLLVIIRPKSLIKLKNKLREITNRNKAYLEVKEIIKKVNEIWVGFCNYFGISLQCRIQLKNIESFIINRIKKLLYWKFSSKPKMRTYVYNEYFFENTWKDGNFELKTLKKLKVFNHKPLHSLSPSLSNLKLNIFLDNEAIKRANLLREVLIIKNSTLEKTMYTRAELQKIKLVEQSFRCGICDKNIEIEYNKNNLKNVELDHVVSLSILIIEAWENVMKNTILLKEMKSILVNKDRAFNYFKENIKFIIENSVLKQKDIVLQKVKI